MRATFNNLATRYAKGLLHIAKPLLVAALLTPMLSSPAHSAIYKCTNEGRLSFSDLPCQANKLLEIWLTHEERERLKLAIELAEIRKSQLTNQAGISDPAQASADLLPTPSIPVTQIDRLREE